MALPNGTKSTLIQETFGGSTLEVGLLDTSTSFTFDPATHDTVSDLPTTAEPTGSASYSRQTLTNVTITTDDTDNEGVLDADDPVFSSLSTPNDIQTVFIARQSDGVIVAIFDDDSAGSLASLPKATNGSDLSFPLSAEGILNIQ